MHFIKKFLCLILLATISNQNINAFSKEAVSEFHFLISLVEVAQKFTHDQRLNKIKINLSPILHTNALKERYQYLNFDNLNNLTVTTALSEILAAALDKNTNLITELIEHIDKLQNLDDAKKEDFIKKILIEIIAKHLIRSATNNALKNHFLIKRILKIFFLSCIDQIMDLNYNDISKPQTENAAEDTHDINATDPFNMVLNNLIKIIFTLFGIAIKFCEHKPRFSGA